ncbi:MAG: hypothetical protein V4686_03905 [Patescibacteria group bacterium]
MAEEKKDVKKDTKSSTGINPEDVFLLFLGILTIFFVTIPRLDPNNGSIAQMENGVITENSINVPAFYDRIFNEQVDGTSRTPSLVDEAKFRTVDFLKNIFYGIVIIAIFLILLFWILKSYFTFKLKLVSEEFEKKIGVKIVHDLVPQEIPANYVPDTNGLRNQKWEMIEAYARSGNNSELRMAIIEADIMLFDVLTQSGFPGSTLGEILKNADKSKLATLDYAWRAHKVRNELAHQGANYVLGRAEAEAALDGYRRVFTELDLI